LSGAGGFISSRSGPLPPGNGTTPAALSLLTRLRVQRLSDVVCRPWLPSPIFHAERATETPGILDISARCATMHVSSVANVSACARAKRPVPQSFSGRLRHVRLP
jgi:hypothetical protein